MNLNKLNAKLKIVIIFFLVKNSNIKYLKRKKIGVIGLPHSQNVGNNLLKFAMFIKLSELGFSPYIIGTLYENHNISFINKTINIRLIKNFSEINENDYDLLMVNSDQTWRKGINDFYDIAFLKFAENWNIPKFTYGVSLGHGRWKYRKKNEKIAKHLLKNFSGISVREISAVKLIKKHLGLKAQLVIDPTFLININYYLIIIKNYKSSIINKINNDDYIFAYILTNSIKIRNYLSYIEKRLNIKIFYLTINDNNQVKEFLYGIIHSKAVITDSYHGTCFSIMFKKPFISFINESNDQSRFNNLDLIFNIKNRIFNLNQIPPISLLKQPLNINQEKLIALKRQSLDYLKKNLFQ